MTRPDRVLFPETGFTKSDAIRYYKAVAKLLLPHLKNRPVSFKRYVDTIRGESFWEKDAPSFTPEWIERVRVPRRGEGEGDIEYILINDVKTLTWVVDAGGLEIHPFLHVAPRIDIATHVVFDLDPGEGADIFDCARVALLLREALQKVNLESYAKVSGSKGIQVYAPIGGAPHATTESFARLLADELARRHPKLIVSKMARALRKNRVFIDWSQNADYKTTVAVYSLRAKSERPYVSMPVGWEELRRPRKLYFEPDEAVARVRKVGDLFEPILAPSSALRAVPQRRQSRRTPKPSSQSGRRLFVLAKTETGTELWLDMRGKFKRWLLRGEKATPAGDLEIHPDYYRGKVPGEWRGRTSIADSGAYEIIEGSDQRRRFDLWFTGSVLEGEWILDNAGNDNSWRFRRLMTPDDRSSAKSPTGRRRRPANRR